MVRIDCHVHTDRSGDCRTPPALMLKAGFASGMDVLCITDHGTIEGALQAARIAVSNVGEAPRYPRVVVGQECRTWAGEIIGLFLSERIPGNLQPEEVVARIKAQGGLVYVPHPFCPQHNGLRRELLEEFVARGLIDLLEVHNAKAGAEANSKAEEFARAHSLLATAASDAHYPEFVGRAYVEVPSAEVSDVTADPQSFLDALARGRLVRGTYTYAEARWLKRV